MTDLLIPTESEFVKAAFERLAADLALIADKSFVIESVEAQTAQARPAGQNQVHISFKLGFRLSEGSVHGCLLMPLPAALSMALYLMMVPDDRVETQREETTLDSTTKDAMLEVGNFLAVAAEAALRSLDLDHVKVVAEGCQGVRDGVRPAFKYREGDPLLLGHAKAKLHDHPDFEMILMVPRICFAVPEESAGGD